MGQQCASREVTSGRQAPAHTAVCHEQCHEQQLWCSCPLLRELLLGGQGVKRGPPLPAPPPTDLCLAQEQRYPPAPDSVWMLSAVFCAATTTQERRRRACRKLIKNRVAGAYDRHARRGGGMAQGGRSYSGEREYHLVGCIGQIMATRAIACFVCAFSARTANCRGSCCCWCGLTRENARLARRSRAPPPQQITVVAGRAAAWQARRKYFSSLDHPRALQHTGRHRRTKLRSQHCQQPQR